MFSDPVIDREKSIELVVHLLKIENEYVPSIELIYPSEEEMTKESFLALREAVVYLSQKVEKVLDGI
jgi:hypothetical protein